MNSKRLAKTGDAAEAGTTSAAGPVVWNALTNYARFAVVMISMLLITPCIIRGLGQENYGLWMLLACIVGYLEILDMGLATATVKFIGHSTGADDRQRRDRVASTILQAYLCLGGLVLLCTFVAAWLLPSRLGLSAPQQYVASIVVIILGCRTALNLPLSLFLGILFGQQKIVAINLVRCLAYVAYASAVWITFRQGAGIITLAALHGIVFFLEHLGFYLFCRWSTPDLRLSLRQFDGQTFRSVLSFSMFALLTNLSVVALLKADPVVIHMYQPLAYVGLYGLAAKVSEQVLSLNKQLINVFTPVYAQLYGAASEASPLEATRDRHTESATGIRKSFLVSTRYTLAASLAIATPLVFWSREVLTLWVGEEFAAAGPVLSILTLAVIIRVLHESAANVLAMTGHHRFVSGASLGAALLNLLLSLLFVTQWGLEGVAWATVAATGLVAGLLVLPKLTAELRIAPLELVRHVIGPVALPVACQVATCSWLKHAYRADSLTGLLGCMAIPGFVLAGSFWMVAMPQVERVRFLSWWEDTRTVWLKRKAPDGYSDLGDLASPLGAPQNQRSKPVEIDG